MAASKTASRKGMARGRAVSGNGATTGKSRPKNRPAGKDRKVFDPPSSRKGKGATAPAATGGPMLDITPIQLEWLGIWIRLRGHLANAAGPFTKAKIAMGEQQLKTKKPPRMPGTDFLDSLHVCAGKHEESWLGRNIYGFPAVAWSKAMSTIAYRTGRNKDIISLLQFIFTHGVYKGLVPLFNRPLLTLDIPVVTEAVVRGCMPRAKAKTIEIGSADWYVALAKALDAQPDIYARPTMQSDITYPQAAKGGMMAYRGFTEDAYALLPIRYWPRKIDKSGVVTLLHEAGALMGVGAWRVERHGIHGAFTIEPDGVMAYAPDVSPTDTFVMHEPGTEFLLGEAAKCKR